MILKVENVEKYYGSKTNPTKVLFDINMEVERGEFISIMGASGSGKTTLLNCISTLDRTTSGNIYINNINISRMKDDEVTKFRREKLGFIFQDAKLLDTLTLAENISLPLIIKKVDSISIPKMVATIAQLFGIEDILMKYPFEVSGGQRQRCASARAIVGNPSLLLADEPTGALDSASASVLMRKLLKLNKQYGVTILMVTHDPLSASYAQRILFLRDGKIFKELRKGKKNEKTFYQQILESLSNI